MASLVGITSLRRLLLSAIVLESTFSQQQHQLASMARLLGQKGKIHIFYCLQCNHGMVVLEALAAVPFAIELPCPYSCNIKLRLQYGLALLRSVILPTHCQRINPSPNTRKASMQASRSTAKMRASCAARPGQYGGAQQRLGRELICVHTSTKHITSVKV